MRRSDVFVFLDDVQYDRRGWRNRNRIKTTEGVQWLTVPVHARGVQAAGTPIHEIEIVDDGWHRRHLETVRRAYRRAPHFDEFAEWLGQLYSASPRFLADFTIAATRAIASMLGITARTLRASELSVSGHKTERLLAILDAVGATAYLSGPSAKAYLDEPGLAKAGIALEWMTYEYPEYPQLHGAFDPQVSILDLLFMTGPDAHRYFGEVTR
jgi:hypothetical protein